MSIMESYWLRTRAAQQKEEEHMKKWMALLLCCLLCLCAAGAMAEEPVTLSFPADDDTSFNIYPNGYINSKTPDVLVPHTGSMFLLILIQKKKPSPGQKPPKKA